jgi:hypothetical protein
MSDWNDCDTREKVNDLLRKHDGSQISGGARESKLVCCMRLSCQATVSTIILLDEEFD